MTSHSLIHTHTHAHIVVLLPYILHVSLSLFHFAILPFFFSSQRLFLFRFISSFYFFPHLILCCAAAAAAQPLPPSCAAFASGSAAMSPTTTTNQRIKTKSASVLQNVGTPQPTHTSRLSIAAAAINCVDYKNIIEKEIWIKLEIRK